MTIDTTVGTLRVVRCYRASLGLDSLKFIVGIRTGDGDDIGGADETEDLTDAYVFDYGGHVLDHHDRYTVPAVSHTCGGTEYRVDDDADAHALYTWAETAVQNARDAVTIARVDLADAERAAAPVFAAADALLADQN